MRHRASNGIRWLRPRYRERQLDRLEMFDHAREALSQRVVNISRQPLTLLLRSSLAGALGEVALRPVELVEQPRANGGVAIRAVDVEHHHAERDRGGEHAYEARDQHARSPRGPSQYDE